MQILVDTSSILFAFRLRKNIFEMLEDLFPGATIVVSKGVINELKRFASSKKQSSGAARIALMELSAAKNISIDENELLPDKWLEKSARHGVVVCTNDIALKRKLKHTGARVLSLSLSGKFAMR